jgi:DNA-binding SARP family transcriptional activator
MTPKLEFCLLGPLVVRCGEVALPVPRGRQRAVLAVLLLNAGRVVSVGEMAETLWGPSPLPSASVTVRNYVKRLRRVLRDADQARILTRSPGYVIRVDPGELDVARFEVLLEDARSAARAGTQHAAALALAIQCGDKRELLRARSGLASARCGGQMRPSGVEPEDGFLDLLVPSRGE